MLPVIATAASVLLLPLATLEASEPTRQLPPAVTHPVDFVKDVEPIFAQHCYRCHGPKEQESSLRLDDADLALQGGDLGPAYVPGNSAASALVSYVAGVDENILMPPEDTDTRRLTASEIGLIRAWIDQGAKRPKGNVAVKQKAPPEEHWAFRRPISPEPPTVDSRDWPRNPIDLFILAKLERAQLTPAAEADRPMLIRRLSLDLTGLPPTPDEIERFVNDSSPGAYEHLVERLLESPHYGERWALWWLDLARYADTNGYEIDRPRSIWLYRDWVVGAFNVNMPFDRFTIEQLAGDLLPNATESQRIATGFHRNTFINEEGGHNWEQFRWESIVDRVSTTSTAFLGLTMACAQCHDHKYDPISQREYYEFFAFLNNCDEPILEVPQPEITAERDGIQARIDRLEQKLLSQLAENAGQNSLAESFDAWRKKAASETPDWIPLEPRRWKSAGNATLTKQDDQSLLVAGDNPEVDTYEVTYQLPLGGVTGIRLEALPDPSLPHHGPGRGYFKDDGTFFLSEIGATAHEHVPSTGGKKNHPLKFSRASASINSKLTRQAIDGQRLTGWHVRGGVGQRHCATFEFSRPFTAAEDDELTISLLQNFAHQQTLGRFRMWLTADRGPLTATDMPLDVEQALVKPVAEWSADETKRVQAYYISVAPELRKEYKPIADLRKRMPEQPTTMILAERPLPRKSHQHIRGDFARPGPEVAAGVPRFLPPLPEGAPRNRLTLARWLVNKGNPLTARVVMNQIWQCYFGRGLVNTPEDFGTQGAAPSHPELLDWLACRFMDEGWDLRQMHRLIVTSATYRQASAASAEKRQLDPENILLSRGARFRLPAETIRDLSLAASGLLNPKLGGPSIYSPQPAGALAAAFGKVDWPTASGPSRYRRGLYTHRKRGAPYGAFAAFDAPPHNMCTMKRIRSNTPLQAMAQLNDELQIEACQALAQRILESPSPDDAARLDLAFERCLSRPPRAEERQDLLAYLRTQQERLAADASTAATVAGVAKDDAAAKISADEAAHLAAWTLVTRAILNLDEAMSKE
jgi:hypothetical protein